MAAFVLALEEAADGNFAFLVALAAPAAALRCRGLPCCFEFAAEEFNAEEFAAEPDSELGWN